MKPIKSLRWDLATAAAEFSVSYRTLRGRLNKLGITPGPDSKFTTGQIHSAVCLFDESRVRKAAAEASAAELDLQERRGSLVDAEYFRSIGDRIVSGMVGIIRSAANMDDIDKERLLQQLRELGQRLAGNTEPDQPGQRGGQAGRIGE